MSFYAQLLVQEEVFTVSQVSWSLDQATDVLGRPDAQVRGGTVEIELAAQPSEVLHFWATDDTKRFDGVLTFFEADRAAVRDRLAFFEAHCVRLSKHFQDANASRGMTMRLTLSANKLRFGEVEIHNNWPDGAG